MKRSLIGRLMVLATIAWASTSAHAIDSVVRKSSDTPAQGTITEVDKLGVTVKPRIGAEVKVPANDIVSVRWDGEPAKLSLARNDEAGGRFKKAIEGYQAVAEEVDAANTNLKRDIEFLIARTTARIALADETQRAEAVRLLEAFSKSGADNFHFYESRNWLAQVYTQMGEFAKAQDALSLLEQAPWTDYKMAASIAKARLLLTQGDVAGALQAFDTVIAMEANGAAEMSQQHEALLGKASCLISEQRYAEATPLLESVVQQVSPNDSHAQAEAYVLQGDCLQALGKPKEAVLAYLHVDVLFAKESALHAEALYHLTRLWGVVGQPERGGDARATLETQYPNSEWAKKLAGTGSQQ